MDAKGRTAMPARFREALQEAYPARRAASLVVVPWFEPCLRVFPLPIWEEKQVQFDAQLGEDDIFGLDEGASDFRRFVYGSAMDCQLDGQGRLLLPGDLREHALIDREVVWMGLGPVLELWDPEQLRQRLQVEQVARIRDRLRLRKGEVGDGG